jgi:hypothetical protein
MSRRRRKQPQARLPTDEVIRRAEKKLRQADFLAGHLGTVKRLDQSEILEFNLSAALTAARSAFYILRDHGGRVFTRARKAWRQAHPPSDMDLHQRMIDLRDDDVHHGTVDAAPLPTFVDATKVSSVHQFWSRHFPEAMVQEANRGGNGLPSVTSRGLSSPLPRFASA